MGVSVSRIRRTIVRVLACSGSVERSKQARTVPREYIRLATDILVADMMAYLCKDAYCKLCVGQRTWALSDRSLCLSLT